MKTHAFVMAIAILILPSQPAKALVDLVEFGAFTTSAWGDCKDPCELVDVSLTTLAGPGTGGAGVLSTTQTLTDTDTGGAGTLFAEATILGGLSTPLLRASAASNSETYATIQAVAAQGYDVVSGGSGQVIDFTVTLTGSVTNPGGDATGLAATVGVVKVTDLGDFLLEQTLLLALFDPTAVSLEQTASGSVGLTETASITVDEGEQFYMWALLGASAGGDGADAASLSTLSIEFEPGAESVLAAAAVPLPASAILLMSALALLGVRLRT